MIDKPATQRWGVVLGYIALNLVAFWLFAVIRARGEALMAPDAALAPLASIAKSSLPGNLFHVLLTLVAFTACAKVLGLLFRNFGQPSVVSEMIAGILLGPSALGWLFPNASTFLLPTSIVPLIEVIAQVGIILYMFVVGLELDATLLRKRAHTSVVVSHASILLPMVLGFTMALWLYPRFSSNRVPFTVFALFVAVSLSVTAFPVLARILAERELQATPLGATALACAAVDDVSAWCLLALVVGIAQARPERCLIILALAVLFVACMLTVVRRGAVMLAQVTRERGALTEGTLGIVLCAVCTCAMATELIGIHALFGAFLLGVIIPHDSQLARGLISKVKGLVVVLFLPAFFALTGMRTQLGLISGARDILLCLVIIAVASVGKFGGSALAARFTGLRWRESAALGVLMNTRGLMELIVLNVGLELKVLSPALFTMLVMMALVTTGATTPLLCWIRPEGARTLPVEPKVSSEAAPPVLTREPVRLAAAGFADGVRDAAVAQRTARGSSRRFP
jgi:Kef-type K+ transport system membrane component KefB